MHTTRLQCVPHVERPECGPCPVGPREVVPVIGLDHAERLRRARDGLQRCAITHVLRTGPGPVLPFQSVAVLVHRHAECTCRTRHGENGVTVIDVRRVRPPGCRRSTLMWAAHRRAHRPARRLRRRLDGVQDGSAHRLCRRVGPGRRTGPRRCRRAPRSPGWRRTGGPPPEARWPQRSQSPPKTHTSTDIHLECSTSRPSPPLAWGIGRAYPASVSGDRSPCRPPTLLARADHV